MFGCQPTPHEGSHVLVRLHRRLRRLRRATRALAVGAARVAPSSDLLARVVLGRGRRRAQRRALLPTRLPISAEGKRQAKLRADQLIEEGFVLRNNPVWKPEPPIEWGNNPRNDSNWHYVINSFEPVETLLLAYQVGAGDRYFTRARRVAVDWIDYNLLRDVPNAKKWDDKASGLRARVFAQILDEELRRPRPNPLSVARLVWALQEHTRFLADPAKLPTGNHAVFMMWGLAYALRALPELGEAQAYARYASDTVRQLARQQFAPDGFHLEHSPEYHLFMTETFADMVDNDLFPELPELGEMVERAQRHFHELYHPNGDLVMLGDSERRAGDRRARKSAEHAPPAVSKTEQVRGYRDSGYAVFRSRFGEWSTPEDDYFLLGAGSHARAHKHADHLSFEWSFRGKPILVDSGKGTHNVDSWMRFFRATRSGNAVEVDERNYDRAPGGGRSELVAWDDRKAAHVVARHYSGKFDVTQTRALVAGSGQYLLVLDHMHGTQPHVYRQWFHFHERLSAEVHGEDLHIDEDDQQRILVVQELTGLAALEVSRGVTKPRKQGFVSPTYLSFVPRHSMAFCKSAPSCYFVTLFAREPAVEPEVLTTPEALTVRWLDARGQAHGVRFAPSSESPIAPLPQ